MTTEAVERRAREWHNPALAVPSETELVKVAWHFLSDGSVESHKQVWQRPAAHSMIEREEPLWGRPPLQGLPQTTDDERTYAVVTAEQALVLRQMYAQVPEDRTDLVWLSLQAYEAVEAVRRRLFELHWHPESLPQYVRRRCCATLRSVATNALTTCVIVHQQLPVEAVARQGPDVIADVARRVQGSWEWAEGELH